MEKWSSLFTNIYGAIFVRDHAHRGSRAFEHSRLWHLTPDSRVEFLYPTLLFTLRSSETNKLFIVEIVHKIKKGREEDEIRKDEKNNRSSKYGNHVTVWNRCLCRKGRA